LQWHSFMNGFFIWAFFFSPLQCVADL
jgi:hypothetical protein